MMNSRTRTRIILAAAMLALPLAAPSVAPAGPAAVAKAGRGLLDQRLPEVKFTNVSLKDAIEFIRDVTGANIHVNWRAIETAGVSQDTNVNMHLREVQVRKALNLLLSEAGTGTLAYYVDQGVIEITTKELADKDMFTRVYPIGDLIVEVPDFNNPPDLSLLATSTGGSSGSGGGSRSGGGGSGGYGGGGGGGGGGSGGLFGGKNNQNADKTKTRAERTDDLLALIRETVYPDIWRENGGPASIRYYNGSLVVTGPRSVHEALGGYWD
jgi:hypothetical protein